MAGSSGDPVSIEALFRTRAGIGAALPQPRTLRGHAGRLAVTVVRRALFWLLLQLDRFHAAVIDTFEDQHRSIEDLNGALGRTLEEFVRRERETRERLEAVEAEIERLRLLAGERRGL